MTTDKSDFARMRYLIRKKPEKAFGIERERSKAEKITTTITGMPHGSGDQSKVERSAIKLAELEDAYRELIQELERLKQSLSPFIDQISDDDIRAAMRLRYLMEYPTVVIADAINKCERHVYRMILKGETEISEIISNKKDVSECQ